jgi:hypothetical protein
LGITKLSIAVPLNVPVGTSVKPLPNAIDDKLLQPENRYVPMLVTPSGIVMLVSPVQFSNALLPMLVTPLGIVTLVSSAQFLNADEPIATT